MIIVTSLDFLRTWRFEINKLHKAKNIISVIGLREKWPQTTWAEVSVLHWSYSKQWIRVQWRTGRVKILVQSSDMKKNFQARGLISISKTTPGSSYMYRYDRCRSLISCSSSFLRHFSVRQLGEWVFKQFLIQFTINTKRTISDTNNRRWIFIPPSTSVVKFRSLHGSRVSLCFSFWLSFRCQLTAFSNAETK